MAGIGCHGMALWHADRRTDDLTHMGGEGVTWIGQAPFTTRAAHVPEPRRRHVHPFGPARDPRGGRRRRQHHLQDPLQRRGRDDRRPAGRRRASTSPQIAHRSRPKASGASSIVSDDPRSIRTATYFPPARPSITATSSTPCSASCATSRASPSSSTTRPAPPKSAAAASAGTIPIPPSASSSTSWSAKAAAIARRSRTASRCSRWRPSSAASARSTSRTATRTSPASRASARASSRCMAAAAEADQAPAADRRPAVRRPAAAARAGRSTQPYNILVTGIGGTGVITIGALLGMAAHLEGKGVSALDFTGLAQKSGAVMSHVRIAATPEDIPRSASPRARPTSCSAATWWSRRSMRAGRDRARARRKSCSTPHEPTAGLRHEPRLAVPETGAMRRRRCATRSARRTSASSTRPARHGADRRFDRDQPLHARLRLAEGRGAAVARGAACARSSSTAPRSR